MASSSSTCVKSAFDWANLYSGHDTSQETSSTFRLNRFLFHHVILTVHETAVCRWRFVNSAAWRCIPREMAGLARRKRRCKICGIGIEYKIDILYHSQEAVI